jgi:hypothetical protein
VGSWLVSATVLVMVNRRDCIIMMRIGAPFGERELWYNGLLDNVLQDSLMRYQLRALKEFCSVTL